MISLLNAAIHDLNTCDGVDGFSCPEPATVHHLASETEYCERHYEYILRQDYVFDPYAFGAEAADELKAAWGWWRSEVLHEQFLYDWRYEIAAGVLNP